MLKINITRWGKWLAVSLILLYIGITYFRNIPDTTLDVDEHHFLRKSYYYDLFFTKRNLSDPRWYTQDEPGQPKVGPYIYGFALHLSGINDIEKTFQNISFNGYQVEGRDWWLQYWWKKLENTPDEFAPILKLILTGRETALIFTLSALFVLFIICNKMKGVLFGAITLFLLGLNSLMAALAGRAMTDAPLLLFSSLNLLFLFSYTKAIEKGNSDRLYLVSFIIGLNCALALGIKIVGILTLLISFALFPFFLYLYRSDKYRILLMISSLMIIIASFFIVFIFLHPYVHHNTIQNLYHMFADRLEGARNIRSLDWGSGVYARWNAIKLIFRYTLMPKGRFTNFYFTPIPIDLVFFIAGFYLMAKGAYKKLKSSQIISGELIYCLWTGITILGLILYLNNDWPRYYLPTMVAITITQSYAISMMINKVLGYLQAQYFPSKNK